MLIKSCAEKGFCCSLQVIVEEYPPVLWIKVETHEPKSKGSKLYYKDFPGNEYGKAVEYYKRHVMELLEEYGKEAAGCTP